MIGLVAIAFGTGGIKPCVSAFGGDQFEEEHAQERSKFFSIFYLSINAGSLISTFVTPVLRGDVQCFGGDCYALAFGVPAALMCVALVVFVSGSGMYKRYPPQGNVLSSVFKCIGFALKNRWKHRTKQYPKREHWMDWATEKYPKKIITEVKMVTRVLFLYIPLPMFWALFDQQGSRWTLQATRMNTDFKGFVAQPDQIQILNPLLILILIPVFDLGIYPLFKLCKLSFKPIPKMAVGMILAALAFVAAAVVEVKINETNPPAPHAKQSLVQVFNLAADEITITFPGDVSITQPSLYNNPMVDPDYVRINLPDLRSNLQVALLRGRNSFTCEVSLREKAAYSLLVFENGTGLHCKQVTDENTKPPNGLARVRFINTRSTQVNVTVSDAAESVDGNYGVSAPVETKRASYSGKCNIEGKDYSMQLGLLDFGGAYTIILDKVSGDEIHVIKTEDIKANSFHVAWQVPQYVLISAGEVMFSITGLEFSYSQAPASMKSVLQGGWLFTIAIGNVIVLIVAQAGSLAQWAEFVLFAALLIAVCFIFSIMGYFYVPIDPDDLKEEDEDEKKHLPDENQYEMTLEEKKTRI
ncbi:hypothetical protein FKM82_023091 [Ascaphus truei]